MIILLMITIMKIMLMIIRTEVFNVTSGSWRQLATLNVGRGMHACALYNGETMMMTAITITMTMIMTAITITMIMIMTAITITMIIIMTGGVMVAGGWTDNNDPDFPGQEVTRTSEW